MLVIKTFEKASSEKCFQKLSINKAVVLGYSKNFPSSPCTTAVILKVLAI